MRQIILNVEEQPGSAVQVHAIYNTHREDATPLENKVCEVLSGMIWELITSMEPTHMGEGHTAAEAQFSIDISKDIRKAGES